MRCVRAVQNVGYFVEGPRGSDRPTNHLTPSPSPAPAPSHPFNQKAGGFGAWDRDAGQWEAVLPINPSAAGLVYKDLICRGGGGGFRKGAAYSNFFFFLAKFSVKKVFGSVGLRPPPPPSDDQSLVRRLLGFLRRFGGGGGGCLVCDVVCDV